MQLFLTFLAWQSSDAKRDASIQALTLGGILIILTLIGGVGILLYRKKVLSKGSDADQNESLMQNLRRLRDSGQMTKEEYDRTRKAMAARLAGKLSPTSLKSKTPAPAASDIQMMPPRSSESNPDRQP